MPLISCISENIGSLINITTEDDILFSQSVTISDGTTSLTGQFSAIGSCTFKDVQMQGTITVSSTVNNTQITSSFSAPYYSTYDVDFGRNLKIINITTDEATLYGQTVIATYDTSKTKSSTFNNNGEATITIYNYVGDVAVLATDGNDTAEETVTLTREIDEYEVELSFSAPIYGVYWDGSSSSAMTRTDAAENFTEPSPAVNNGNGSSPFDNILPWSGMEIVDDATVGKLISIPKYYYKWTKTGTSTTLQVSMKQFEGSHVSPAHADRGDGQGKRDVVYVGRYHCATSTYKSTSGVKPAVSTTRSSFRTSIHNIGSDVYQYDFAMWWTINMLYLVEYADWNSQSKIGYSCSTSGSVQNSGLTDAMTYHTGTSASSRTTYGHIQYRHIEDLWGNVFDWCDGIYFLGSNVYVISNPSSFSDTSGGTLVGTRPTSDGFISAWSVPSVSGLEWALYPSAVSGSTSTYVCDYCYYDSEGVVLRVGGSYTQSRYFGALYLSGGGMASFSNEYIGSRLMKLP